MTKRKFRVLGLGALVGVVVGLVFESVKAYLTPNVFETNALLEVKPLAGLPGDSSESASASWEYHSVLLKSRPFLREVVKSTGTTDRWNVDSDTAVNIIAANLRVKSEGDGGLLRISLRNTRKEDVKKICEAIVVSYREKRVGEIRDHAMKRRDLLAEQITDAGKSGAPDLAEMRKEMRGQEMRARLAAEMVVVREEPAWPEAPLRRAENPGFYGELAWFPVLGVLFSLPFLFRGPDDDADFPAMRRKEALAGTDW